MSISPEAQAIHDEAVVLLAHLHFQRAFTPNTIEYDGPNEDRPGRQADIPKLRRGGVNCIWLSEGGPGEFVVDGDAAAKGILEPNLRPAIRTAFYGSPEVQRMLRGWDAMLRLCQDYADDLEIALSVRQARDIVARGKIAVFMHTEALLIANDLAMLRAYHALGMRATGLAHGSPLDWVDNDLEQHSPPGLTEFGREVIHELNKLGIVIDLSHASPETIQAVIEETRQPIVASHSNPQRLSPIRRNLTDEVLRAIADTGGVVGIHCCSAFVDIQCLLDRPASRAPANQRHRLEMVGKVITPGAIDPFKYESDLQAANVSPTSATFPTTHLERLIDHVDYLVNLIGIEHVGIGTDFQYLKDAVVDFDAADKTPNVTDALVRRGYTRDQIHKILGANFLRVMETVLGE